MKKIIAIMLALVILMSFAACKNNKDDEPIITGETVAIDVEVLKADWQTGELFLLNGKKVSFPCKLSEFFEQSGLESGNAELYANKEIKPGETISLNVTGDGVSFRIKAENTSKENANYLDTTVFYYSFNNTNEANRQIKFAGTLSPGATRKAVEEALGIPEGQTSEDKLYYYKGENANKQDVKLTVSFDSETVVNSVAFEISL